MKRNPEQLPLRKKLLFSVIPVSLLLLLLVLTEVGLRFFAPSLANPFTRRVDYASTEWQQINRRYLQKYFPTTISILPELKPSLFRAIKTDRTFRVVCLGGSSMFGTPYQMTTTIPGMVRTQLRHLFPDREIEVLNLGASAINSNVVRDMLEEEVLDLKPDLVLVYMGHNEFYGPDGVGASGLQKSFPWLTPIKYRLQNLRIFNLLSRLFTRDPESRQQAGNLMRQVSRESHVPLNSDETKHIAGIFRDNLRTIVKDCKSANVPVVLSDITSNLLFPPFASDSTVDGIRLDEDLFRSLADQKNWNTLRDTVQKLITLDSTNALLRYWHGRALLGLGEDPSARAELRLARDLDLLKFRAPSGMNSIIHKISREENVPCVLTDSLFSRLSPAGIPGNDLFWEHLHPTAKGYYEIARLFVSEILRRSILSAARPRQAMISFDPDSLALPWLDFAYADLSMQHLTSQWPFQDYHVEPVVTGNSDVELVRIATDVYHTKTTWDEGCLLTAARFRQLGVPNKAITTYRAMLQEFPYEATVHYRLAVLFRDLGNIPAAVVEYDRSIASDSAQVNPYVELALLEVNRGHFDRAIALFNASLRLHSDISPQVLSTIYYGLAGAVANKGDIPLALRHLDHALRLNPAYESARQLKAALLRYQSSHP